MSTSDSDHNQPVLRNEVEDGIATLTLARPAQRNALTGELMEALTQAIETHGQDPDIRVIIIAADGPAFCAGHDMKQLTTARESADHGRSYFAETFAKSARLMTAITQCPRPVIAQVQGVASAAGCQLVATCDLAVTSDNVQFITPGVDIGLFCSTPMVALSRNVPRKQAMEMLLLGDGVDAERARELGLVNWVVPPEELRTKTLEIAHKAASKSLKALAMGKQAFHAQMDVPLAEAYEQTVRVMTENMLTQDAEEGIGAFFDKRTPEWCDK